VEKHPDISMGNILGSNFSNLALGFGVASIVSPFKCTKKMARIEFPLLFAMTMFFIFCCVDGKITRLEGLIFLGAFVAYAIFSFSVGKKTASLVEEELVGHITVPWPAWKSTGVFLIAAFLLASGAHLVVTSCLKIATIVGVSQSFIGFSLLALGTSAPEIFVVATAARHRHHAICAGNIMGSNLMNLTLVVGLCSLIHPIFFTRKDFLIEAQALVAITVLSWYIFGTKKVFSRLYGAAYIAIYLSTMFLVRR
jgi:cation:H+ antiporter